MKKDKISVILFVIASVFQVWYFRYRAMEPTPFAFILGLKQEVGANIRYLDICVLCLPVCMWLLLFSDYYSFYMENYGRVLLVRNCSRTKMLLGVYGRMGTGLLGILGIQFLINCVFFSEYLMKYPGLVGKGFVAGACVGLFLLILELGLCAFIRGEYVHLVVNLYVFISCFVCFYSKQPLVKLLFLPGKLVYLGVDCEVMSLWEFLGEMVAIVIILIGVLFGLVAAYCKKKDIF